MPQGFNIGPLTIRFYAILIILGALLAAWLAARQAKKGGQDPEIVLDLMPWLLIGGIIGARLWHVFTPSASNIAMGVTTENYLKNPIEILKMWKGGLGIPGGVIGGAAALIIYTKIKKLNFWQWADFIAPGLLIAQAIGRWGNFVNQEVYGRPSNLPWAITIDPQYRIAGFEAVEKYHPLFLYESLLNLLGAGVLLLVGNKYKDKLYKGDLFFGYLVIYPTIRFFLEFLRLDPSPVNGINVNQTAMLVVGVIAILVLILRHTVWSDKLAQKELKLAQETSTIVSEMEELPQEVEEAIEEADALVELDETEEPILDDEEFSASTEELIEENEDWVVDHLPAEAVVWDEDEIPNPEEEDLPKIDGAYPNEIGEIDENDEA